VFLNPESRDDALMIVVGAGKQLTARYKWKDNIEKDLKQNDSF